MAGTKKSISTTKSKQKTRTRPNRNKNRAPKDKKTGGMSCCCAKKNDKKKNANKSNKSLRQKVTAPPMAKSAPPMAPTSSPFPARSPLHPMASGPGMDSPPTMPTPPDVSLRKAPPKPQMPPKQPNLEAEKIATARDGGESEKKKIVETQKKEETKKKNLSKEKMDKKEPAKDQKPLIFFKTAEPIESESDPEGKSDKTKKKKEDEKMIKEVPRLKKTKPEELESDSNQPEQCLTIKRMVKNGRVIVHWTYNESYPVGMDRPTIQAVFNSKTKMNDGTGFAESGKKNKPIMEITKSLAACADCLCKGK